jgi:two-component system chemotaxis response regulator CheY
MAIAILVVDDSPTLRGIVKIYMRPLQVEVMEADGGARALELARLAVPTLILADINMPGMDGIEFVKQLRADPRQDVRRIPVIFLTGDKSSDLRARAAEAGADDFLEKPVKSGPLQDAVKRILERSTGERSA